MRKNKKGGLVYSTDQGRLCPGCGRKADQCSCRKGGTAPVGDGIVRLGRETKGRKGAGVTTIRGLPLVPEELAKLAGALKKRCGSGGTVKDGVIEIQGEHRQLLTEELLGRGFRVKQ